MKRVLIFANVLLMLVGSSALYADETGGGKPATSDTTTQSTDSGETCGWLDKLFGGCDE